MVQMANPYHIGILSEGPASRTTLGAPLHSVTRACCSIAARPYSRKAAWLIVPGGGDQPKEKPRR